MTKFVTTVKPGDTIRDHRNRPHTVGKVAPLRADGRVWGVYAKDGCLIERVRGVAR